jgi:hypothetical protein
MSIKYIGERKRRKSWKTQKTISKLAPLAHTSANAHAMAENMLKTQTKKPANGT